MGLLCPAALWWLAEQEAAGNAALAALDFIGRNLGSSVVFFALDIWVFVRLACRLHRQVSQSQEGISPMLHTSQLLDYTIQVFFIIGVIYTAIGMRGALLYALGDSVVSADAGQMLKRLVEGGILLALSTTIVGYLGGVMMKIIKKNTLELRLQAVLEQMQQSRLDIRDQQIQALLQSVESLSENLQSHYEAVGVERRNKEIGGHHETL